MDRELLIYIDDLSKVFNRRYLNRVKENILSSFIETDKPFSIAVTDIDHFKEINDIHGHLTGDAAIKFFADFLKENLRKDDIIIRYGGDEFIIIQSGMLKNDAFLVWQRLIEKLRDSSFHNDIKLSISVGVASFPEDGNTFAELFKKADERLYLAKRSGRGRVGIEQAKSIKIPPMRFVNRTSELDLFLKSIEKGTNVIIRGEAGIGKTRFVREVLGSLRDIHVLWSDCLALEHRIPYYPIIELLKYRLNRNYRTEILENLPPPLKIELNKVIPDIVPDLNPDEIKSIGETVDRYRLFEGFRYVLNFGQKTKVIVIDNIQWMDSDSIEALKYIIKDNRNIFIFLSRIEERDPEVEEFLKQLSREKPLAEIILSPLDLKYIKEMTSIIIGETNHALEDYVARRSSGNAFYTEELIKTLYEHGYLFLEGDTWSFKEPEKELLPRGINDLARRKFDLLSPKSKKLLTLLSVARKGYIDLLVELSGMNEGLIFDIIEEGIKKGLLKEHEDGEYVSFRAELLRQSIYNEELSNLKKRFLHKKVAEWLEKNKPAGNEEEIAYHYFMAKDTANVIKYGEIAGDKARKIYANHEAIKYYRWAIEAIEPELNEIEDSQKRKYINLLLSLSSVYSHIGELEKAESTLHDARILCEKNGYTDLLAKVLDSLSGALIDRGKSDEALKFTQEAIELSQKHGYLRELLESYNTLGILLDSRGRYEEAMEAYQKALQIAEELNDTRAKARVLNDIALIYQYTGDYEKALKYYEEAEQLFTRYGSKDESVSIKVNLSLLFEMQRDLKKALRYAEEAYTLVKETGNIIKTITILNNLGIIYLGLGEFDKAERYFRETIKNSEKIGDLEDVETGYINLGIVLSNRGKIHEAIELYKKALKISIDIKDRVGEIVSRINLASKIAIHGYHDEAIKEAENALLQSKSSNLPIYIVEALLTLSEIYLRKNNIKKSLEYLNEVIKITKNKKSFQSQYTGAKLFEAEAYIMERDFERAEKCLKEAETILSEFDSTELTTRFFITSLKLYVEHGERKKAESMIDKVAESLKSYPDAMLTGEYNVLMGKLYGMKNNPGAAEEHLKRALSIYKNMEAKDKVQYITELIETYKNRDNGAR